MTSPESKDRGRSIMWTVAMVISSIAIVLTAIFLLSALTGPIGPALILIVGVLFAFVGFHYVVWGRWLGPMIRADVEAESDETEAHRTTKRGPDDTGSRA